MAITSIKSTYSLDVETGRQLEEMARRWRVSKSEALRRAIHAVAQQSPEEQSDALEALNELQGALKLTSAQARAWVKQVMAERRSSGRS